VPRNHEKCRKVGSHYRSEQKSFAISYDLLLCNLTQVVLITAQRV
jgi:hypothetical protein